MSRLRHKEYVRSLERETENLRVEVSEMRSELQKARKQLASFEMNTGQRTKKLQNTIDQLTRDNRALQTQCDELRAANEGVNNSSGLTSVRGLENTTTNGSATMTGNGSLGSLGERISINMSITASAGINMSGIAGLSSNISNVSTANGNGGGGSGMNTSSGMSESTANSPHANTATVSLNTTHVGSGVNVSNNGNGSGMRTRSQNRRHEQQRDNSSNIGNRMNNHQSPGSIVGATQNTLNPLSAGYVTPLKNVPRLDPPKLTPLPDRYYLSV